MDDKTCPYCGSGKLSDAEFIGKPFGIIPKRKGLFPLSPHFEDVFCKVCLDCGKVVHLTVDAKGLDYMRKSQK